jgi:outer membrane protein OmpA-like peptidoglycan-associated protein
MLDQEDEGTRIGVWATMGVVALVVFGLLAALVIRQTQAKTHAQSTPAAASATLAAPGFEEVQTEGDAVGSLYFGLGQSALPVGADAVVGVIAQDLLAEPAKKVVLSGFHDASGSAAANAEVAKQRAIATRAALVAEGVTAERIVLRKPEQTLGDADPIEARRVDVHLAD